MSALVVVPGVTALEVAFVGFSSGGPSLDMEFAFPGLEKALLGLGLKVGAGGVLVETWELTSVFGDPISVFVAFHVGVSRAPVDSNEQIWISVQNEDVAKEDEGHGLSGM